MDVKLTYNQAGTEYARSKSEVFNESIMYRSDGLLVLVTPDRVCQALHVSIARVGGLPSGLDALLVAGRFFGEGEYQAMPGTGDRVIHLWGRVV